MSDRDRSGTTTRFRSVYPLTELKKRSLNALDSVCVLVYCLVGFYVNVIHIGIKAMEDPINGRLNLYWVVAYFILVAIGPVAAFLLNNAKWEFSTKSIVSSMTAIMVLPFSQLHLKNDRVENPRSN